MIKPEPIMLLVFPIILFRISHFFDPIILTPSPIILITK